MEKTTRTGACVQKLDTNIAFSTVGVLMMLSMHPLFDDIFLQNSLSFNSRLLQSILSSIIDCLKSTFNVVLVRCLKEVSGK